jgi:hypothetical protein
MMSLYFKVVLRFLDFRRHHCLVALFEIFSHIHSFDYDNLSRQWFICYTGGDDCSIKPIIS